LTPEKSKEESPIRQPGTRKHEVLCSSKKKKTQKFDKNGNPLTNTMKVNDNQEKKEKPDQQRITNYSRYESSPDKNKKDLRPKIQPGSRKNELVYSNKNERIQSYEQNKKYISNNRRNSAVKDKNKDDKYNKYNKDKYKHNQNQKTKTNYDSLTSPYSSSNKNYMNNRTKTETKTTPYSSFTQPIQGKDKNNNKKYDVYKKPQNIQEKTSFPRHTRQSTGIDSSNLHIPKDEKNKPSYNSPYSSTKYQTQSGFYPNKNGFDNDYNKSKTNEGWYPNQKGNKTTHYNQKNEDYNQKYISYKINYDKTSNKVGKSDKINISYNSPTNQNKHINNFSNNNYSSKPSGKDKSTNFNIQSKYAPYKQPKPELKYFSPNNKVLKPKIDILSNKDKYYYPNRDDNKKYIVREDKSPSTSFPKKSPEKDKYPKYEPKYQGYMQKEQYS
jgi:hypothetical protein